MATFYPVPRNVPSSQRATLITSVSAGDQIDIEPILGRPARQIKFIATDPADEIQYKLNNYIRMYPIQKDRVPAWPAQQVTAVRKWSSDPAFATFTLTGASEFISEDALSIASIEIVALTLSTGTTIEIEVY
jgi:hypothetical protein